MKTVMIVDDSRFMCDEIRHLLDQSGYQVTTTCRDAEEAIRAYSKQAPDLVLMDIILPGIDGIEATSALLGKWPDARVIIVSSMAYDDTIERAKTIGAKGFVCKPFTREDLLNAMNSAVSDA